MCPLQSIITQFYTVYSCCWFVEMPLCFHFYLILQRTTKTRPLCAQWTSLPHSSAFMRKGLRNESSPFPGEVMDLWSFFFLFSFFCNVRFLFVFPWLSGQPWRRLCVLAEALGSTLKDMFSCAVSEANARSCWQHSLEKVIALFSGLAENGSSSFTLHILFFTAWFHHHGITISSIYCFFLLSVLIIFQAAAAQCVSIIRVVRDRELGLFLFYA